jgi:hypothetical protein
MEADDSIRPCFSLKAQFEAEFQRLVRSHWQWLVSLSQTLTLPDVLHILTVEDLSTVHSKKIGYETNIPDSALFRNICSANTWRILYI